MRSRKIVALCISAVLLAGCSLPRGAALQSEILDEKNAETPTFQVVPVTRQNTPTISAWPKTGGHGHFHWPSATQGSNSSLVRAGDRLNVTIWDSQENSLLSSATEKFTKLDNVPVEADGTVFLPYVNGTRVEGMSPKRVRERIQEKLTAIIPSAQVQVSLVQGFDSEVDVVSGVNRPGSFPLPSRNYKVLNALADAGGIPSTLRNPRVKLLRGSRTYQISADALFASASKNALLQPRDTIVVEQDDRSFVALGASGTESLIYFPKDHLTALEAVSLMGGLSDERADPKGVLVLRQYPASKVSVLPSSPDKEQVVFTLDLTSADGLFAAQNFQINPDDTVLATESPVSDARTLFTIVGGVLGFATQVRGL